MNNVPAAGRIAIVFDGKAWYVRTIETIEHDLEHDHMVYHCDRPIGSDYKSLRAAIRAIRWKPAKKTRRKTAP